MKPLKALLVEDSKDDAALLLRHLSKEGYDVQSELVQTAADMRAALAAHEWDIILSDYVMPNFTGLDALAILKESGLDIPIIIISGTIGEDIAVEAMLDGVNDYLMKGNLTRLAPAIEREIENAASRRAQQQAEETLHRSEASLANAQRIAHIGNFDWDIQHKQIFWSDEVYRILNLPKGSIESSPELVYKYIHPDDKKIVKSVTAAAFSKAATYEMEIRVVRPGGEVRIVHLIGELKFDKSGEPLRLTATIQDITERRAAEAEIRLMKSAIDSIVEGIHISDAVKPDNPIIYTNAAFENLTGYAFEEIRGQNCRFLQGSETNQRTADEIREALEKETSFHGEILNYRKNGESFWNYLSISPIFDEAGRLTNFVGVQQDISERKQAETILQASEARIRQLVDSNIIGITTTKLDGSVIEANDVFLKTVGYSRQDLLDGKLRWDEMTPPEIFWQDERAKEQFSKFGYSIPREKEYIRKDGSRVPVMVGGTLLKGTEDTILAFVLDISEQKRVEEEKKLLTIQIERQHERLNNVVANVPGVVWEAWGAPDAATQRIDFVSEYVETMLGYSVEEWLNTPNFWLSIVHPEDKERIAHEAAERFLTGNGYTRQFRWIAKDGHIVWVESKATVIRNKSGQSIGLRGINIDITDRKLADRKIRESEERHRIVAETANDVIITIDDHSSILFVNSAMEKTLGYKTEELIGKNLSIIVPERLRAAHRFGMDRYMQTGRKSIPWNGLETHALHRDGAEIQIEISFSEYEENNKRLFTAVMRDITERKKAQQIILESEEKYRSIVETANEGIWLTDLETRTTYVNRQMAEMLGYTVDEMLGRPAFDFIFKEDLPAAKRKYEQRKVGESETGEFRLRRKDGSGIITLYNTTPRRNQAGEIIGFLSMRSDITERKKAEDSIRFQAHLLNTVEQSVIATDLDGIVTYWNQFAEKLYGWTVAEAVGRNIRELTTPENNQEQADQIMTQLSAGKSWSGEFTVRNKDGEDFPAHVSNSPVIDSDGKITGVVGVSFDITERSRAEKALREAEDKYRTLVETSPAIVYLAEPHPPFATIYVSPNVTRFGYPAEEWSDRPDMWVSLIHDEDRARVLRTAENAVAQGEETDMEYRVVAKDGAIVWLHDKGSFVLDEQGNTTGWQGMMVDITKNKELEDQLRQSQKLESVGLLAGGIAHDFNNMLTAINGYSELTLRKLKEDDPLRRNIEEIKKAGERSADLTHQLLAFSRQQVLQPVVLNINVAVSDTIKMLQRLIGEDIQITTVLSPKVGRVKADPGQFSQIVLNLAVNARDAMPQGGKLTIETANVFLDPDYARKYVGVLPGAYVMLAVSDTGTGMSAETKERIFEPFFTTKEVGQGTGLGLATVYGIVKQSGGTIEVKSEQGFGTTFKIYLPRVADEVSEMNVKDIPAKMPKGTETILLVEDEETVRNLSRAILEECGFTVIEAMNGIEALEICEKGDCEFDLLMTDVVMPKMGGRELADLLKEKLPDLPVLFTSGYTDDAVVRHGVIELGANFIQKPFTPDLLAKKIQELLDSSKKRVH